MSVGKYLQGYHSNHSNYSISNPIDAMGIKASPCFHGNESIFMAAMVTRPTKVFVQNLIPFPECFGKTLTRDQMKFHTESILSIIFWIIDVFRH